MLGAILPALAPWALVLPPHFSTPANAAPEPPRSGPSSPWSEDGWSTWRAVGPFPYSWEEGAENPCAIVDLQPYRHGGEGPDGDLRSPDGVTRPWDELHGEEGLSRALNVGRIDIATAYPPAAEDHSRLYLHRTLDCTEIRVLALTMGSDDGLRVWWNGELVVDQRTTRSLNLGDASARVTARPGRSHLLVELCQRDGGYAFEIDELRPTDGKDVDAAIEKGVRWLLEEQWLDGSWGAHSNYGGGHPAYAAYTLLKMGVPQEHPSIRRALEYVRRNRGDFTYTAACELLLLSELGASADKGWMKNRVRDLVDWQESSGQFGYPLHPDGNYRNSPDLSNTLFTALALHAAARRGVKVPTRTWQEIVNGTLRNLGRMSEVTLASGERVESAGFYYWPGKQVTGSITTAGLSILNLAERAAEKKIPRKNRNEMKKARERALVWLGENLDYSVNPGEGAGHHFFFLYGVERTASLLGLNEIGGMDWYQLGADYLVRNQNANGHWGGAPQVDTLLALLFLKRASAPRSGRRSTLRPAIHVSSLDEGDVLVRTQGGDELTMYIDRFSDAALEAYGWEDHTEGLAVKTVEYSLLAQGENEGEVIAVLDGDPTRGSGIERFPHAHSFPQNGTWSLECRVTVAPAAGGSEVTLRSSPIELVVDTLFDDRSMLHLYPQGEPVFSKARPEVTVSSTQSGTAEDLIDGTYRSSWLAKSADELPRIRFELRRPARGGVLVLTHARPRLRHAGSRRVSRVAVRLDGEEELVCDVDPYILQKTSIDLGKRRFKTLEVEILETVGPAAGAVGFSEITLLSRR